jgi:hypothetical protein
MIKERLFIVVDCSGMASDIRMIAIGTALVELMLIMYIIRNLPAIRAGTYRLPGVPGLPRPKTELGVSNIENGCLSVLFCIFIVAFAMMWVCVQWLRDIQRAYKVGEAKKKHCDGSNMFRETGDYEVFQMTKEKRGDRLSTPFEKCYDVLVMYIVSLVFLITTLYVMYAVNFKEMFDKGWKVISLVTIVWASYVGSLVATTGIWIAQFEKEKLTHTRLMGREEDFKPPNKWLNMGFVLATGAILLASTILTERYSEGQKMIPFYVMLLILVGFEQFFFPKMASVMNAIKDYANNAGKFNEAMIGKVESLYNTKYVRYFQSNEGNYETSLDSIKPDLFGYTFASTPVKQGTDAEARLAAATAATNRDTGEQFVIEVDANTLINYHAMVDSKIGTTVNDIYGSVRYFLFVMIALFAFIPFHKAYISNEMAYAGDVSRGLVMILLSILIVVAAMLSYSFLKSDQRVS